MRSLVIKYDYKLDKQVEIIGSNLNFSFESIARNTQVHLSVLEAEIKAAFLPKRKKNDSCSEVSRELPWALLRTVLIQWHLEG